MVESEETPSLLQICHQISYAMFVYLGYWWRGELPKEPTSYFEHMRQQFQVRWVDLFAVIVSTGVISIVRHQLTEKVFRLWSCRWRAPPDMEVRVVEHLNKIVYYSLTWCYTVYLLLYCRPHWFYEPTSAWMDWTPNVEVPADIYILYVIQFGFYVHGLYATVYLEERRKDFTLMIVHHIMTLTLVAFSFATRHYAEGVLVFFCHDVTDVFLESFKLNSSLRQRDGGRHYTFHDWMANVSVACFLTSWFFLRIMWYLQLVLYPAFTVPLHRFTAADMPPFLGILGAMLGMLLVMNIYWFGILLYGLYRFFILGDMKEVDDIREKYTDEAQFKKWID